MHRIGKLGLQVFAAPDNMTGQEQVQVKAREIDFVTSFGKNIQALLDVLGIIRMIKKDNNTVLKTKKVTGNLQSGEVAEGEEIPYSQYAVEEIPFDTIKISKYRKGVTLEAITCTCKCGKDTYKQHKHLFVRCIHWHGTRKRYGKPGRPCKSSGGTACGCCRGGNPRESTDSQSVTGCG